MRTQGSLVLCWTLLDILLSSYMIPVVNSIIATPSSSSGSVYATHSSSSDSVYAAHSSGNDYAAHTSGRCNDYAAHSGSRGNDYAAHTSGRGSVNIAHTSRRKSLLALFTEPAICTATAPTSVAAGSTARKPAPLCQSAWYRDLLQGVCRHGGGAKPPAPSFPSHKEPEQSSKEEHDLVVVGDDASESAATAVEKEWTKNFASPECGAKLGMVQLSPRPANIFSSLT
jgi:hypothetical protein